MNGLGKGKKMELGPAMLVTLRTGSGTPPLTLNCFVTVFLFERVAVTKQRKTRHLILSILLISDVCQNVKYN